MPWSWLGAAAPSAAAAAAVAAAAVTPSPAAAPLVLAPRAAARRRYRERLLIIQPGSDARFNETTHQHVTYSPTFHPFLILCSANPVSPSSRFLGFGIFRNAPMSRGTSVSFVVVWSMPPVQQTSDVIIVAMTSRSKIDRSRTSISRWEFLQFFFLTESV